MDSIDNLCYWDFMDVMEHTNAKNAESSGKSTFKKISKSQQAMINTRKEQERKRKEGKK